MTRFAITSALLFATIASAGEDQLKPTVEKLIATMRVSQVDFDLKTLRGQDEFKAAYMRAEQAGAELTGLLMKQPSAWKWARPGLRKMPRAADRRDMKLRLIELLSYDTDAESMEVLAAELAANDKGFPVRAIIRMDWNGAPGADKALDKIVAEKPAFRNLEAAIHLGLKGNKNAKPVLDWAVKSGAGSRQIYGLSYATAIACKRLGDADPWLSLSKRAQDEVETYLKKDDLNTALHYAAQLEFYSKLADGRGRIEYLALPGECAVHIKARRAEVKTTEDVRKMLQGCLAKT